MARQSVPQLVVVEHPLAGRRARQADKLGGIAQRGQLAADGDVEGQADEGVAVAGAGRSYGVDVVEEGLQAGLGEVGDWDLTEAGLDQPLEGVVLEGERRLSLRLAVGAVVARPGGLETDLDQVGEGGWIAGATRRPGGAFGLGRVLAVGDCGQRPHGEVAGMGEGDDGIAAEGQAALFAGRCSVAQGEGPGAAGSDAEREPGDLAVGDLVLAVGRLGAREREVGEGLA